MEWTEERISELERRAIEIIHYEQQRETSQWPEKSIRNIFLFIFI